jgi:site-specific DNA-methyltransferase (adenine-specific)
VGSILSDGRHLPLPADVINRLTTGGWEFWERIIWNKCTAGVRRAGTAIQQKCPGYFYSNIMTEEILVFRKPGPRIYKDKTAEDKKTAAFPIDDVFVRDVANDIWCIPPVPPRFIDHPCPLPEEIPYRLISLYSFPGNVVLDVFAGSGQVLKVAHALGRQAVGYEIVPQYADLARRRMTEPLRLRKMQIVARFDKTPLGNVA